MLLRKWKVIFLWKKSLFVFWPSPKDASGSYCQKWARNSQSGKICSFFTWPEDQKLLFCEKNHFLFSSKVKRVSFLPDNEFLAHFWQYDPDASFGLGQTTKSDFRHKKITFSFQTKSKKCIWVILPKMGQKLTIR